MRLTTQHLAVAAALVSGALVAGSDVVRFLGQPDTWLLDKNPRMNLTWDFVVERNEYSGFLVAIRDENETRVLGTVSHLRGSIKSTGASSTAAPTVAPEEDSAPSPNPSATAGKAMTIPGGTFKEGSIDIIGRELEGRQQPAGGSDSEPYAKLDVVHAGGASTQYTLVIISPETRLSSTGELLHAEVFVDINGGTQEKAASPRFAVARDTKDAYDKGLPSMLASASSQPFPSASIGANPSDAGFGNGATQTAVTPVTAAPTASSSAGAGGSLSGSSPGSVNDAGSSASSKGGLSTGAIAGIAVACGVVGLALISGLVFWLVRRRARGASRSKDARPYGGGLHHHGGGSRTQELIAEKEAQSGVRESSPHSPHSDVALAGPAAAAHQHHSPQLQQERSYTPYSDHPVAGAPAAAAPEDAGAERHEQQRRDLGGSPRPLSVPSAAGTDAAGQARYAHLIEEGMTPEEIARIEDEERQLDAAIEQAARR